MGSPPRPPAQKAAAKASGGGGGDDLTAARLEQLKAEQEDVAAHLKRHDELLAHLRAPAPAPAAGAAAAGGARSARPSMGTPGAAGRMSYQFPEMVQLATPFASEASTPHAAPYAAGAGAPVAAPFGAAWAMQQPRPAAHAAGAPWFRPGHPGPAGYAPNIIGTGRNDGSSASEMVSVHSMKLSSWGSLHSRSPEGSDGAAPAQRQSLP